MGDMTLETFLAYGAATATRGLAVFVLWRAGRLLAYQALALGLVVLAAPVKNFAYPNGRAGDFDETTIGILTEDGYDCVVTTVSGANDASTDPFALRRAGMWAEDTELSACRLAWSGVCT
jgi:hypothetical protein